MILKNGAKHNPMRNSITCGNGHESNFERLLRAGVYPFHQIYYYCATCKEEVAEYLHDKRR